MERKQGAGPGSTSDSSSELLGRYTLLNQIAQGELSAVYLARQQNNAGFQRLLVVKRLRAEFARTPELVQLMLDEARLISALHHANLVSALDAGTDGGAYVVMDYVEGTDLAFLLERAGKERHARLVVPLIVDVLNGLHAVHTSLDAHGEPLRIVHQAPRGRHVLVGIDGTARLCDFTQATARVLTPSRQRSDRLRVSAMAPEQALQPDQVDHRVDVFVVGLLLWEALTGERLFAAGSDEQTFQNLLHRRVQKPSEVGLRPPRCFDAICLRALERDPKNRYASTLDMARDLRDTALNQALYATNGEIGQWVKALSGSLLIERRRAAGSDAASQDIIVDRPPSTSGYYESTKADPYGSGLIYGGSFTRVGHGHAPLTRHYDPDKTPAIGTRVPETPPANPFASRASARPLQEDEPTGKTDRLRKTTEPMWVVPEAEGHAPAPQSAETTVAKAPSLVAIDADPTHPAGFVPAKAGARRDTGLPSPGAYSAVSERKTRPSDPSPFDEEAPTSSRQNTLKEKPQASDSVPANAAPRVTLPPLSSASLPAARPVSVPSRAARENVPRAATEQLRARVTPVPSSPAPEDRMSRPRAAIDGPSPLDSRLDSTPARRSLPPSPVGSPYRAATPSKAPGQFDLRKAPRALEELTGKTRIADVIHVVPDSLVPPDSGARTLPPPPFQPSEPARSNRGMWVVVSVLAAIIVTALGVSAGKWIKSSEVVRVTASQPQTLPESEAMPKAPEPTTAVPSQQLPAAEMPKNVTLTPPAGGASEEAKDGDAESVKRRAKQEKLAGPSEDAPSAGSSDEQEETSKNVKPRREGGKSQRADPIPDNPY